MTRTRKWKITYGIGLESYSGTYEIRSWNIREAESINLIGVEYELQTDLTAKANIKSVDNGEKASWQIKRALIGAPFEITKESLEAIPAEVGYDILDEIAKLNKLSKKAKKSYIG